MAKTKKSPYSFSKEEVNNYVKSRGILLPNNQVFLTEPLKVFKKVLYSKVGNIAKGDAIANLIIPKGALVNLAVNSSQKMRASFAICYSIVALDTLQEIKHAVSKFDFSYVYTSVPRYQCKRVEDSLRDYFEEGHLNIDKKHYCLPEYPFSSSDNDCASGIHFFVDVERAKDY